MPSPHCCLLSSYFHTAFPLLLSVTYISADGAISLTWGFYTQKNMNYNGIPYTTLNELMNDKSHINQITSETTCKLCLYFDCSPQNLLDDFPLLQNSSGKYLGLRYQWRQTKKNGRHCHESIFFNA